MDKAELIGFALVGSFFMSPIIGELYGHFWGITWACSHYLWFMLYFILLTARLERKTI